MLGIGLRVPTRSSCTGARKLTIKRGVKVLRTGLLFAFVIAGILFFEEFNKEAVNGNAAVIDGDSLRLQGREIRLFGIDAPEIRQTCTSGKDKQEFNCGKKAAMHLKSLTKQGNVKCEGSDLDKFDRLLAICSVGDVEINRKMVSDGWAVAFGAYYAEESEADRAQRGLWKGEFQSPSQWRRDTKEVHERSIISAIIDKIF